ncbi:MAG TPA: lysophospholipid acyltransferase family protein [Burkholderiales bacterium]
MLKLLFSCVSRLPLSLLHAIGGAAGAVAWHLPASFRRHIAANMTQAGYADPALHRAAAREIGRAMLEIPAIWLRPLEAVARLVVETQGWEHIEAAQAANRPIVFLTPHLGCFEITAQAYAHRTRPDKPITALYRPPRKAMLTPLITAGRNRPNMRLAAADLGGVRALIRALRNGEAVGLLPDQAPRFGEGVWAPFFGRPAFTLTLVRRLVRAGNAVILLAFAERLPRAAGYRLVILPFEGALSEDEAEAATQMNQALESLIRRIPTQYLWNYNRYKVPPGVPQPPAAPSAEKPAANPA